jgi:hypothetical protein
MKFLLWNSMSIGGRKMHTLSLVARPHFANFLPIALALLAFDMNWTAAAAGHCFNPPLVALAVSESSQRRQEEDWKALEQRWSALVAQRRSPDITKWNSLEADFRAFAKKYDLHLEEHAKRAKPDLPVALVDALFTGCPPRDDGPRYRGYLFPGPKGVCRYVCVPTGKK